MYATKERDREGSFWRDVLDGLAGPSAAQVPARDAVVTSMILAARHELMDKLFASDMRQSSVGPDSLADRMRELNALFETIRDQFWAGKTTSAREAWRRAKNLIGSEAERSTPFQNLGRRLDEVPVSEAD